MIPVLPQPEPTTFDQDVRRPGKRFLLTTPNPTPEQFKGKAYWRRSLSSLYEVYGGICAYCAHWIPETVGDPTVDHFLPKSNYPDLAYEWSNYRLAALRYNRMKYNYLDVLDPFQLKADWFFLNFPIPLVKPNPKLATVNAKKVTDTITRLKLNDEISVRYRKSWIKDYCEGRISFEYLKDNAPFTAYELERQGLISKIASMLAM